MVSVTIDNVNVKIPQNSTILEACDFAGIVVPRFCFHEKLMIAGNCRMCIVEIEKFPKPISSCTMNVNEGMKIFTKTPMVKKAQESVLEFLLINHPLDCPICDQGGECDLQDQLLFFGSDSSRFFKYKRGVEDKNCSLLIKTIMTRCIHCTRCVRFLTEVAGDFNLGTLGRSSQSEIGSYLKTNLESEFSGNVIDLCPVGALTSKPYSFKGRSWELTNYNSIDILDGLGSNIILSVKGSEVMRILPSINESINMEWISDKTRFFYDSFDYLRIKKPWSSKLKSFIKWSHALNILSSNLKSQVCKKNTGVILGDLVDLETVISSKLFLNNLGSSDVYSSTNPVENISLDNRSDYLFNTSLLGIEKADVCLFLGVDPRTEASLLNLRLRQQVQAGCLTVGYVGPSLDLSYEAQHLGLGINTIQQILSGRHPFCKILKKSKKACILTSSSFYHSNLISSFKSILNNNLDHSFNVLSFTASNTSFKEVGIVPFNLSIKKSYDFLFLVGTASVTEYREANPSCFIVYLGSHYSVKDLEKVDLVLPASLFLEKYSKYLNTEGLLQKNNPVRSSIGEARPEWFFFLVLSYLCGYKDKTIQSLDSFYTYLEEEYPFINKQKKKIASYYDLNRVVCNRSKSNILRRNLEDFYLNNILTKSSKTMILCSETKEQKNFL